jgi:hypothetical protein
VLIYNLYNNVARQLPYVSIADDLVLDYSFVTGKMTVKFSYAGSGVIGGVPDQKFRYVLIPSSSFNGRISAPVNYNDYNAVCEYFGIPK